MSLIDDSYVYINLNHHLPSALFSFHEHIFGKPAAVYLEMGTMYGNSLAVAYDSAPPDTVFLVIDTFLGSWQNWETDVPHEFKYLAMTDGSPTIFKKFLANMKGKGIHDSIVPLQITSVCGMQLLQSQFKKGRIPMLPNIIYLDTSHLAKETLFEIEYAWCTLPAEGGILYGDDWTHATVMADVIIFANQLVNKQPLSSEESITIVHGDTTGSNNNAPQRSDFLNIVEEVYNSIRGEDLVRVHSRVLVYRNQWVIFKLPDDHVTMCKN